MSRSIWKGAITFGLVHIPVALVPASQESGIDFDWLDKRSMDPVGYKRVNKRTGKEIAKEQIVKGVKTDDGSYVLMSDEEIARALPKTTQVIEIETFVKAAEIEFVLLEKPYHLEPIGRGERVYALLREAMMDAGVIGIARVVMHSKEHLCALVPAGSALVLNTLRWAREIRPIEDLKLPAAGKEAHKLKPAEMQMAGRLIAEMTRPWQANDYDDRFTSAIETLIERKVAAGQTAEVTPLEDAPEAKASSSNVVDLTELLANSLSQRKKPASAPTPPPKRAAGKR